MFAWNYCVELFARIQKKASGAYLMRRPRPFCMDQTAEIGGVVCSCALRSRALRISIARCNNCSNSQRSIRGPVSRTFRLCVTVTEICSSVGKLQCSKFTKHPLQKNCRTLSSAQQREIVSRSLNLQLASYSLPNEQDLRGWEVRNPSKAETAPSSTAFGKRYRNARARALPHAARWRGLARGSARHIARP